VAIQFTWREFVKLGTIGGAAISLAFICQRFTYAGEGFDPVAVKKFGASLKGRLILPGDPSYNSARKIWNPR
jgi:hypothetical protein